MKSIAAIIIILCVSFVNAKAQSKQYFSKSTPYIGDAMFSPDGTKLLTWNEYGGTLWDAQKNKVVGHFESTYDKVKSSLLYNYLVFDGITLNKDASKLFLGNGFDDNYFVMWNTATQEVESIKTFDKEQGYWNNVAVSNDFENIAYVRRPSILSSQHDKICLYNISKDEIVAEIENPEKNDPHNYVISLTFSPDNKKVLISYFSGDSYVWDLKENKMIDFVSEWLNICKGYFNSENNRVTIIYQQGVMGVYDLNNGKEYYRGTCHLGRDNVKNSGDAFLIRTDSVIEIWDLNRDTTVIIKGADFHKRSSGTCYTYAISNDNNYLVTIDYERVIDIWDLSLKKKINTISHVKELPNRNYERYNLVIDPESKEIHVSTSDYTLGFNLQNGKLTRSIIGVLGEPVSASFTKAPDQFLVVGVDKDVKILNINEVNPVKEKLTPKRSTGVYNYETDLLALQKYNSDTIAIYNVSSESIVMHIVSDLISPSTNQSAHQFDAAGRRLFVYRQNSSVIVFDTYSGGKEYVLQTQNDKIQKVVSSGNSEKYVVLYNTKVEVVQAVDGKRISTITTPTTEQGIGITYDGSVLIKKNELINANSGKVIKKLEKESENTDKVDILYSCITPKGNMAITAGESIVFVWDTEAGELLRKIAVNENQVIKSLQFINDSQVVMVKANPFRGSELLIYNIETGSVDINGITSLAPIKTYFTDIKNERILTTSNDGTCRFWTPYKNTSSTVYENRDAIREIPFTIAPNPTEKSLRISLPMLSETDMPVVVHSVLGEKIFAGKIDRDNSTYDLQIENWQQGTYFIEIHENNKRFVQQFQIMR